MAFNKNIVLIGYRCCGKTTVGKILAAKLNRDFIDLDEAITTETGCDIKRLVSEQGWPHFRRIERRMIQRFAGREGLVLATGGGVVLDPDNVKDLKQNGLIVYMEADAEVLHQRMQNDRLAGIERPPLTGDDPLKEIEAILKTRSPLYAAAGDFTTSSAGQTPEAVADTILAYIKTQTEAKV